MGPHATQSVGCAWQLYFSVSKAWDVAGMLRGETWVYGISNKEMLHEASVVIMIRRAGGGLSGLNLRPASNCGVSASLPVWSGGEGAIFGRLLDVRHLHCMCLRT